MDDLNDCAVTMMIYKTFTLRMFDSNHRQQRLQCSLVVIVGWVWPCLIESKKLKSKGSPLLPKWMNFRKSSKGPKGGSKLMSNQHKSQQRLCSETKKF